MRQRTMGLAAVLAAALALGGTVLALAATPEEIIADRRANYKHMGENFKAMKDTIDAGADVRPMAARAAGIAAWAQRIPTVFPPGTETGGGTHARPEVWSDRENFVRYAGELQAAALKLEAAAQSGDKAAFATQWKATGQVCGTCHQTYRARLS